MWLEEQGAVNGENIYLNVSMKRMNRSRSNQGTQAVEHGYVRIFLQVPAGSGVSFILLARRQDSTGCGLLVEVTQDKYFAAGSSGTASRMRNDRCRDTR